MTPDSPTPRQVLEARLTALLLGELPAEEAAALRERMATDDGLAALHERLKQTVALVRETTASAAEPAGDEVAPLKLSDSRRQKLLAQFKTVAPKEFAKPQRRLRFTVMEMAVAAAILLLLAALSIPTLRDMKSSSQRLPSEGQAPSSANRWLDQVQREAKEPAQISGRLAGAGSNARSLNIVGYANVDASQPFVQTPPSLMAVAGTAPATPPSEKPAYKGKGGKVWKSVQRAPETAQSAKPASSTVVVLPTPADSSVASATVIGDPQWVGILNQPNAGSSPNPFVSRYAYNIGGTADKSIDLAYNANTPAAATMPSQAQPQSDRGNYFLFNSGSQQGFQDGTKVPEVAWGALATTTPAQPGVESPTSRGGGMGGGGGAGGVAVQSQPQGQEQEGRFGQVLPMADSLAELSADLTRRYGLANRSDLNTAVQSVEQPAPSKISAQTPSVPANGQTQIALSGQALEWESVGRGEAQKPAATLDQIAPTLRGRAVPAPATVPPVDKNGMNKPAAARNWAYVAPEEAGKPLDTPNQFTAGTVVLPSVVVANGQVASDFDNVGVITQDTKKVQEANMAGKEKIPVLGDLPETGRLGRPPFEVNLSAFVPDLPLAAPSPTIGQGFFVPATGAVTNANWAFQEQLKNGGDAGKLGDAATAPASDGLEVRRFKVGPEFRKAMEGDLAQQLGVGQAPATGSLGPREQVEEKARQLYSTLGADLTSAGRSFFYNDLTGELVVRAAPKDLEKVEGANQLFSESASNLRSVIPLEHADSQATLQALQDTFGPQGVGGAASRGGSSLTSRSTTQYQVDVLPSGEQAVKLLSESATSPATNAIAQASPGFSLGRRQAGETGVELPSYDRSGFYRMMSQAPQHAAATNTIQLGDEDREVKDLREKLAGTLEENAILGKELGKRQTNLALYKDNKAQTRPGTDALTGGSTGVSPRATNLLSAAKEVDRLRAELHIPDAMAIADGPSMLMSAETLRKLESQRIEAQNLSVQSGTLYDKLKVLPKDELMQALPRVVSDTALSDLLTRKVAAEQSLIEKQKAYGEKSTEVTKLTGQIADLNEKINGAVKGVMISLQTKALQASNYSAAIEKQLQDAQGTDLAQLEAARPYFEAKKKLEQLEAFQRVLKIKIATEGIDVQLPKTAMVDVVDKALPLPAPKPSLLQRITGSTGGQVESKARVRVERDFSDIQNLGGATSSDGYDPYFVQTETELIQSEPILDKVVKDLNLSEAWAKKSGGRKLSESEARSLLKKNLDLRPVPNTEMLEIGYKSADPKESADIANAVALAYRDHRHEQRKTLSSGGISTFLEELSALNKEIAQAEKEVDRLMPRGPQQAAIASSQPVTNAPSAGQADEAVKVRPPGAIPEPQPEIHTRENAWSTFSLNVADVSFKLAAASLEKGQLPDPAGIRSEEFINAFDYRDPEPPAGVPIAFAWERARYPFAHNRDLLRFSVKTAAEGRQQGKPLNIVLLMDNSGSMERADRVQIIHEALRVLAVQLNPQDVFSVVTFSRTARLWVDGVPGSQAAQVAEDVSGLTPQGGTNLEDAMNLAYQTAQRHYLANGINRVVLLTDGAANLGDVQPESLKQKVEAHRKEGIALDCFGVGWEGYNDDLLEVLSRHGDGRYGFLNSPEEAASEFAGQLAGALHVAAADVKVQVEFNPARVTAYRQIGYAKHQLTKEQFRDNTVDAAEIGAAEQGNALYVIETNPGGEGPLCVVRVRFKLPGTSDYREHEWAVPFVGNAPAMEQASHAMRLAATASAFSEWLASSPYASEVTPDKLLGYLNGVPEVCGADARPKKLEWMIRQAKSIAGK